MMQAGRNARDSLRVALLAGTLRPGGAEKQLTYCARQLAETGVEVRLFSLTRPEVGEGSLPRLDLRPIWVGPSTHPFLRLIALERQLRPFRPHVIQSFHGFTNLYVGLLGRWLGAIGVGALRTTLRHFTQANGAWTPWLFRAPTGLVVNSYTARRDLLARGYVPPAKVFVLPNVIDLAEFDRLARSSDVRAPARAAGPRVMFIGRLVPEKRGDRFLMTLAAAARRGAVVTGLIVGGGPDRGRLEALSRTLGLSDQVTFLGHRADVPALLARADMLVSCSDDEGLPNVILEAMAAGRPVITTPAGDAGTLVADGINGYVVPFNDVSGIGDRIVRLAASPGLRRSLGASGRRLVEHSHSTEGLAHRLLSIYREMASGLGRRHVVSVLEALAQTNG